MTLQATTRYPGFDQDLRRLVDKHRKFDDEPLRLAIYYQPNRELQDIFLFEVIENFGTGSIDPGREIFEVTYNSSSGFPLEPGQRLHLLLTNPNEFKAAVRENWPAINELRDAIRAGSFHELYSDPDHADLKETLNA